MQSTQYFGKTAEVFQLTKLKQLLDDDLVNDLKFTASKKYILTYFANGRSDAVYFYEPDEHGSFTISNDGEIMLKKIYKAFPKIRYSVDGNKGEFKIKEWFESQILEMFQVTSDPTKPMFFSDKTTKQSWINVSKGFKHKTIKPFNSYPKQTQQDVHTILNHIKQVWNSGNEKCYEYCLNWLACAMTGHKRHTAIFLKSGEGTGKSIIIEFLINYVIGEHLGLITSRSKQLLGFNGMLLNKMLVVLEELPAQNKSEWHCISDILKDLITGKKLDIEKKFEDMIQVVNLISLIILTNNENTIKMGKDMRRYFMADISHDKVGDTRYFDILQKACNALAGEAMFMYFLERYQKIENGEIKFDETQIPITLAKLEMKERNSTKLITLIKETFIKFRSGIHDKRNKHGMLALDTLKEKYSEFAKEEVSMKAFAQMVRADFPILKLTNYGKNKELYIVPVAFQELLNYFKEKGFWEDKYDQFDPKAVCSNEPTYKNTQIKLMSEILQILQEMRIKRDEKWKQLFQPANKIPKKKCALNSSPLDRIKDDREVFPKRNKTCSQKHVQGKNELYGFFERM